MESNNSNFYYSCDGSSWRARSSLSNRLPVSDLQQVLDAEEGERPGNGCLVSALSAVIRKRRLSLSMSQQVLSEKTGLDRSYLISIEHGKRNPSITTLSQIAAGLQMSTSELLNLAEIAMTSGG